MAVPVSTPLHHDAIAAYGSTRAAQCDNFSKLQLAQDDGESVEEAPAEEIDEMLEEEEEACSSGAGIVQSISASPACKSLSNRLQELQDASADLHTDVMVC